MAFMNHSITMTMANKKGDLSMSEVVDVANRTYEYMFNQLSRGGI